MRFNHKTGRLNKSEANRKRLANENRPNKFLLYIYIHGTVFIQLKSFNAQNPDFLNRINIYLLSARNPENVRPNTMHNLPGGSSFQSKRLV